MEENVVESSAHSAHHVTPALHKMKMLGDAPYAFEFDKLTTHLIRFINQLKKSGRSMNTISAYRNDLSLFCEFLIEKQISPDNYTAPMQDYWVNFLKNNGRISLASTRRAHMSVRTFLHFLVSENIIAFSPLLESKSPKQPTNILLTVPKEKFAALCRTLRVNAQAGDTKATRDLSLILVLGECGLKASEAANLTWGDVWPDLEDEEQGRSVSGCLRVSTGVGQERLVPYAGDTAEALSMLREVRKELGLSSSSDSKLFFGYLNVSRKTRTDFLHRHGIKFVVYEVCTEFLGVPYNSESLRNHAILRWLGKGMDNEKVATLAGYSSLNSLERFLKYPGRKKFGAARKRRQRN